MNRVAALVLLAFTVTIVAADESKDVVRGPEGARLLAVVERLHDDDSALAVSVSRKGKPLLRKAFGLADRGAKSDATLHTLFDTGSVAKQFTAAAVLRLAETGKLSLEDPVRKFFPSLPAEREGITVAHLLHHTAGISARAVPSLGAARTPDQVATRVLGPKPTTPPGKKFEYSNRGYCLLAALIETVSGRPFEAYLREALFRPAGLKSTGFCQDPALSKEHAAKRYGGKGGTQEIGSASYYAWGWGFRGCTGVVTSILDLERWIQALDSDHVLTKASKEALFAPGAGAYALGWQVTRSSRGTLCRHHGGSSQGFSAYVALYPQEEVAILILTARQDLAAGLHRELEQAVLGEIAGEDAVTVKPEVLARYVGAYDFSGRGALEVSSDADGLRVVGVGQEPFSRLYYASTFRPQWLGLFERVNKRARQVLPLLENGDLERVKGIFNDPRAAAAGLAVFRPSGRHEILGTDTGKKGMHTYLRLTVDGKARGVTLAWGRQQKLDGVSATEGVHPFPMRLTALSKTEFQGKGVFGGGFLRFRFPPDGSRLEILEPDGVGSAPITCPRR